jgi:hypothetical protein
LYRKTQKLLAGGTENVNPPTTIPHLTQNTKPRVTQNFTCGIQLRANDINKEQNMNLSTTLQGADKSLARPGRKQATVREDFDFHISYL